MFVVKGVCTVLLQAAWRAFQEMGDELRSAQLRRLTMGPAAAGMAGPLKELQEFTDWEQAAELGRILPRSGADAKFDEADTQVRSSLEHIKACISMSVLRPDRSHCRCTVDSQDCMTFLLTLVEGISG